MLSLAIYTNSKSDLSIIRNLSDTFINELNINIFDIFLFSDNLNEMANYDLATLSTFHMEFYKDYLIFMNLNDYLSYRDRLLTKKIFLYIKDIESLPDNVDRNLLKEFAALFTQKNGSISMVKL